MIEYYVGLSLAPSATIETGIAVLDQNNTMILVDKFFTMKDVQHFFDNYSSLKNSKICISLSICLDFCRKRKSLFLVSVRHIYFHKSKACNFTICLHKYKFIPA